MREATPEGVHRPAGRPALWSWALYDWANSPFFAVILTFVFATYFTEAVAADSITGTAAWGKAMTVAALLTAILSPLVGALVDAGGRRKPWLGLFTALAALACWHLWSVLPDPGSVGRAMLLIVLASVAFELAQVVYNAMLPDLAPADRLGRWSGWGWGLGYLAGILALVFVLVGFIQAPRPLLGIGTEAAANVRVVGPFVAIWLLVFALPLFLLVPDRRSRAGTTLASAVRQTAEQLRALRSVFRREPAIGRFLIARLVYNDGLNTLFAFGGIYAAGLFAMDTTEIIWLGIALNVTAGIGCFAMAGMDDRKGSKTTILVSLGGLTACGLVALLTTDRLTFWMAALLLGCFIGPAQAASRTLMARLAPPGRRTEMFGLYALSGKLTAFAGPLLFGTATLAFGSQRAGMAVVLLLLIGGGLLLWRVPEPPRGM